jgi:pentatricopeptide repeat protein
MFVLVVSVLCALIVLVGGPLPRAPSPGGKPKVRSFGKKEQVLGTNLVSFNTRISACMKTGNINRARELVRKMMLEGP